MVAVLAIAAGGVTVVALVLGVWQFLCGKQVEAANWVMAAAWAAAWLARTEPQARVR
jgi:hypothetical protein